MSTLTPERGTPGQAKQISRVGADALESVIMEFILGVSKKKAQRVHARGNEFTEAIRKAALDSLEDLAEGRYVVRQCCSDYVVIDTRDNSRDMTGHLGYDRAEKKAEELNDEEGKKTSE